MEKLEHISFIQFETQYLAHPAEERATGNEIQKRLEGLGVTVINPFNRSEDDPQEWRQTPHSPEDARRVVERDLAWIRQSDAVFAYVPEAKACGTMMEIFAASKLMGKPVFIYTTPQYRFHPWLMYFGQVFTDLGFMFEVLGLRKKLENYGFRIAFTGRMGTGKSSVADFLVKSFGFKRYSFAAKLKEIASDLFGMSTKDRLLLQTLGTKVREVEQDSWANFVLKQIETEAPLRATIDDMRYLNEGKILKENGFTLIRLYGDRKNRKIAGLSPETERHPSETETDKIEVDYALDTSGSLDLCYRKIMDLLQELSLNEQNPT